MRFHKIIFFLCFFLTSAMANSVNIIVTPGKLKDYYHIEVLKKDPLSLQLTEPNVFFRQAYGRYINYTGALKPEDNQKN